MVSGSDRAGKPGHRYRARGLPGALAIALATWCLGPLYAAECPKPRELTLPALQQPEDNIDKVKDRLKAYQASNYEKDIAAAIEGATKQIGDRVAENRALPVDQMKRLAIVLDIDETSLSNWKNIEANNFGFIPGGTCPLTARTACGFNAWIDMATAPAIEPTLQLFNFAKSGDVAVFFISGRRKSQREATILNLDRAKFEGWRALTLRDDNDHADSIVPFKSGQRAELEKPENFKNGEKPFTIIANIGDQQSDLAGGFAECGIKLTNPFYFIK
jgi:predicted secreted acid phosphatase